MFLGWSPDDQAKALAYTSHKNSICSKCGTNPAEWLDTDGTHMEPPPYEVHPQRCLGCDTLAEERGRIPSSDRDSINLQLRRYRGSIEQWQMKQQLV